VWHEEWAIVRATVFRGRAAGALAGPTSGTFRWASRGDRHAD